MRRRLLTALAGAMLAGAVAGRLAGCLVGLALLWRLRQADPAPAALRGRQAARRWPLGTVR